MPPQRVQTGKSYSRSSKSSPARLDGRATAATPPEKPVHIGTVVRVHGLRGAVVVAVDPSARDVFTPGLALELATEQRSRAATVATVTPHRSGLLVHVEGVSDRSSAEGLVGAAVWVDRDVLPRLAGDEYYDFEITGCDVVTAAGDTLGVVTEIIVTGANDVYVVTGDEGELLVPATVHAVIDIDRDQRRIVVDPRALEYSGSKQSQS